jgi:hypothetical protein
VPKQHLLLRTPWQCLFALNSSQNNSFSNNYSDFKKNKKKLFSSVNQMSWKHDNFFVVGAEAVNKRAERGETENQARSFLDDPSKIFALQALTRVKKKNIFQVCIVFWWPRLEKKKKFLTTTNIFFCCFLEAARGFISSKEGTLN